MKIETYIPKNMIPRESYLQKAIPLLGKDIIKIFSGQRRVGKSYLLFLKW